MAKVVKEGGSYRELFLGGWLRGDLEPGVPTLSPFFPVPGLSGLSQRLELRVNKQGSCKSRCST